MAVIRLDAGKSQPGDGWIQCRLFHTRLIPIFSSAPQFLLEVRWVYESQRVPFF